ncbi:MAG: choice-of-anchor Q domain-containing protein, partial [Bacteroidota bacterium]|nr:choice-of-anchor Q domain-containing protein [Bacteroidota bacterium]
FTNNTALFGGGIFNHGQNAGNASPVITNCIFSFNTATGGGGGIDNFGYNGNASPVITNCVFYGNTATDRAGAIYCWGGGNGNASPVILNSLFVNNSSVDGGAIVCDRLNFSVGSSGTATPAVRNSIFWGNTASGTGPQFITFGGGSFQATYSLIDINNQNPPHTINGPGTGNIFTSPSFISINDADGTDNCWLTSDDGLQLQSGSTGIDAGQNTGVPLFDIRNYNRISNGVVDMGAYEFNSTILPVTLLTFYGRTAGAFNRLFWNTMNENNNRVFEVQRSIDRLQFEILGELAGAVNSGSWRAYEFTDDRLTTAVQHYYRLKQIDMDGRYTFSRIVLLRNTGNKQPAVVMPNPVVNSASILFAEVMINEAFQLFNSNGQLVGKLMVNGKIATVDLKGKAAGSYLLANQKLGITIRIQKIAE